MNFKTVTVICIAIILLGVSFLLYIKLEESKASGFFQQVDGEIILCMPDTKQGLISAAKVLKVAPKLQTFNYYVELSGEPVFSTDGQKAFIVGYSEIYEYDFITNRLEIIKETDYSTKASPQYIAALNKISFVDCASKMIYLFDINTRELTIFSNVKVSSNDFIYSWSNDGKYIYLTTEDDPDNIARINSETGEKEVLFNGFGPMLSYDNKMMLFKESRLSSKLIARDMETGEKYLVTTNAYYSSYYKFSPDNEFVAVLTGAGELELGNIEIFDVNNHKSFIIVDRLSTNHSFSFDWK